MHARALDAELAQWRDTELLRPLVAGSLVASTALREGVSVIVPSHHGVAHVGRCLESLGQQTLDPAAYEVIVVLNGEPDGSREAVAAVAEAHPRLELRVVELVAIRGVGRARNAGIAAARRSWMALIDDDDWVSPTYLAALLDHAAADVVPLARLVDVRPDGVHDEDTRFNRACASRWGMTFSPADSPGVMSLNACRLLPSALVKAVGYDEDLRSGVDVEFMARLFAAGRFLVHAVDPLRDAAYFRSLRPMSVSRQEHDFTFAVEGRLDVIERIAPLAIDRTPVGRVVRSLVSAQASFIRRYVAAQPAERAEVVAAIERRGLPVLPFEILD